MTEQKRLVERLGYAVDDRLLIVNCDDLGSSHAANVATYRAMIYGVATSATLMVPCPWAREAVRMFRNMAVGVHLTLTAEYSGYRWGSLTGGASLHDDEGYFPATAAAALARVEEKDARAECRAQLDRALAWGVDVTHLDAHMYVAQSRADLFDVCLGLAVEYGLPVRILAAEQTEKLGFDGARRAAARGVLCNDHLVTAWPRRTRDVMFEELPAVPAGVTEIFAHPVLDGEELRGYDQDNADIRVEDTACLIDPAVARFIEVQGFKPISFRPLRDLQRQMG
jgi:chitin disaccharide deacetylase